MEWKKIDKDTEYRVDEAKSIIYIRISYESDVYEFPMQGAAASMVLEKLNKGGINEFNYLLMLHCVIMQFASALSLVAIDATCRADNPENEICDLILRKLDVLKEEIRPLIMQRCQGHIDDIIASLFKDYQPPDGD